ncbi:hypothetical protein BDQ17DRAFT_1528804 [Cyathus striatus]|nr:hypothetical protein BDQ17DRAFT_1528804 [Cyathus striatus]
MSQFARLATITGTEVLLIPHSLVIFGVLLCQLLTFSFTFAQLPTLTDLHVHRNWILIKMRLKTLCLLDATSAMLTVGFFKGSLAHTKRRAAKQREANAKHLVQLSANRIVTGDTSPMKDVDENPMPPGVGSIQPGTLSSKRQAEIEHKSALDLPLVGRRFDPRWTYVPRANQWTTRVFIMGHDTVTKHHGRLKLAFELWSSQLNSLVLVCNSY